MLLESYLNNRLSVRTVAIVLSLTIAVFTQGIVTLLHEIEWDYLRASELFILTIKEGLPSIPIILNLSLIISWVSLKKELYQKKEVHALWLSGWDQRATTRLILSSLLKISFLNIFILYIAAPCLRDLGPTKNTDWIQMISKQEIPHSFVVSATDNKVLIGESLSARKIGQPLFLEFDEGWHVFQGEYAQIKEQSIDLFGVKSLLVPNEISALKIDELSLPLLSTPAIISKEFYAMGELLSLRTPKAMGEMIWRAGLVLLPWVALWPFRSLSPNLNYRKENSHELSYSLSWFSCVLLIAFLGSKLPVILQ